MTGHKLDNMRSERIGAGYSIGDLAKRAGIGDWTIVTAENGGTIDVTSSQRIAAALGVSLATLGKRDY